MASFKIKTTNDVRLNSVIMCRDSERLPLCLAELPFLILSRLFQSETNGRITNLLDLLPDCHKTIAPAVQGSDSGGQELVIRDGVWRLCYTTEYPITKYASDSKLNKRNGNKLIALAARADFNPSKFELTASGK